MAVPGETLQNVVHLLRAAGQPNRNVSDPARQQLDQLDETPYYKTALLNIFSNTDLDLDTRLVAAIVFKNSVERFWSARSAKQPMRPEEKEALKERLMKIFATEKDNKIAAQIAVIISKIARKDWPNTWDTLFPDIMKAISSNSLLEMFRGVEVLYMVLEALASKAAHRRHFQVAARELVGFSHKLWQHNMGLMIKQFDTSFQDPSAENIKNLTTCTKVANYCSQIMFYLIVYGCPKPEENEEVKSFFENLLQAFTGITETIYPRLKPNESPIHAQLESELKEIVRFMCLTVTKTQSERPLPFSIYLPMFLDFFYNVVLSFKHQHGKMGNFIVQALTFLSNVIDCKPYQGKTQGSSAQITRRGVEFDTGTQKKAQVVLNAFFTERRIDELTQELIMVYFPLRAGDFEEWRSDPEQFFQDTLLTEADEKIRTAAQYLFRKLLRTFQKFVGPIICKMFLHVTAGGKCMTTTPASNTDEYQSLLLKDAVYQAVGIGYDDLFFFFSEANIDFNTVYKSLFAKEVQTKAGGLISVIRRRVAWLIGEFVDTISDDLRPHVFESLLHVLGDEDMVLKLTASDALMSYVNCARFTAESFAHIQIETCKQLLVLVEVAAELEPRRRVMAVLKVIIQNLRTKVTPSLDVIFEHLPRIWDNCADQNLLRLEVIGCLAGTVEALSYRSYNIHNFLMRVLKVCTNSENQETAYMVEYGFELWEIVLEKTPILTDDLNALFSHWIFHMRNTTSHLQLSMSILDSYIYLGGSQFVKAHAHDINQILHEQLTSVKDEGMILVTNVIDTFAQMFPAETPTFLQKTLEYMLMQLLESSTDNSKLDKRVACHFINVFARLAFQNCAGITQLVGKFSETHKRDFFVHFVTVWCDLYDRIQLCYKKKLSTLALCNFLVSRNADVVKVLLPRLVEQVTSAALSDANEDTESSFPYFEPNENKQEWTEVDRRMYLFGQDPAYKICTKQFFQDQVKECARLNGAEHIDLLLKQVDPLVMKQFNQAPIKKQI